MSFHTSLNRILNNEIYYRLYNPKGENQMAQAKDYVELKGRVIRETDAALLLMLIDPEGFEIDSHWFPLSQIDKITRVADDSDDLDTILVAKWLVDKKNIDY